MTSDACREMRAALGAAALGGCDPAEELALRAHLDGCAACRAELDALTSVARALPLADPTRVTNSLGEPPRELGDRVVDRIAAERTARRFLVRRRVLASAAAAIVAVAAVIALLFVTSGSTSGERVAFPALTPGVSAHATLLAQPAGTRVQFHVSGLHYGDYYWLWLTGDDGDRVAAGTFRGTGGSLDLTMNAAIELRDARRIWVTDAQNAIVLDSHLPART